VTERDVPPIGVGRRGRGGGLGKKWKWKARDRGAGSRKGWEKTSGVGYLPNETLIVPGIRKPCQRPKKRIGREEGRAGRRSQKGRGEGGTSKGFKLGQGATHRQ